MWTLCRNARMFLHASCRPIARPLTGCIPIPRRSNRLGAIVELERGKPAIAPTHARRDLIGRQGLLPLRQDTAEVLAVVDRGVCRAQRAQARTVAPAVILDTARRVELDVLKRPHE